MLSTRAERETRAPNASADRSPVPLKCTNSAQHKLNEKDLPRGAYRSWVPRKLTAMETSPWTISSLFKPQAQKLHVAKFQRVTTNWSLLYHCGNMAGTGISVGSRQSPRGRWKWEGKQRAGKSLTLPPGPRDSSQAKGPDLEPDGDDPLDLDAVTSPLPRPVPQGHDP